MRPLLLVLLALPLMACGSLISAQQEVEIGQQVDQQIRGEYRLLADNDPVARWARELVQPLEAASVEFRDPAELGGYKVKVIADDELVNAFAAPGGFTYLSTGLVLQAKTCAEIVGVMGHELAHVTQKHGVKALEGAFAAEQLAGFFLEDGLAKDGALLIWGFLQSTSFSREDEAEADEVGLQIAHGAAYNPYGLADFFSKLLAMEKKSGGSGLPDFLSSHPATDSRVKRVRASIQRKYGDAVSPDGDKECRTRMKLKAVQDRIKAGQLSVEPGTGGGGQAEAAAEAPGPV